MLIDGNRGADEEITEVEWGNIEEADREPLSAIEREMMKNP